MPLLNLLALHYWLGCIWQCSLIILSIATLGSYKLCLHRFHCCVSSKHNLIRFVNNVLYRELLIDSTNGTPNFLILHGRHMQRRHWSYLKTEKIELCKVVQFHAVADDLSGNQQNTRWEIIRLIMISNMSNFLKIKINIVPVMT